MSKHTTQRGTVRGARKTRKAGQATEESRLDGTVGAGLSAEVAGARAGCSRGAARRQEEAARPEVKGTGPGGADAPGRRGSGPEPRCQEGTRGVWTSSAFRDAAGHGGKGGKDAAVCEPASQARGRSETRSLSSRGVPRGLLARAVTGQTARRRRRGGPTSTDALAAARLSLADRRGRQRSHRGPRSAHYTGALYRPPARGPRRPPGPAPAPAPWPGTCSRPPPGRNPEPRAQPLAAVPPALRAAAPSGGPQAATR